ncbi:MAG: hypothetical protein ABI700_23370 [Chloroflexota bacterium]
MAKSIYDHQVSFHVTKAMHTQITRLADTRNMPIAEIGREAVRIYLSDQEDLQGSRKYFSKGLLSRLDYLEWLLTVLLFAVCKGLSALISTTSGQKLTPNILLDSALKLMQEQQAWLHQQYTQDTLAKREEES